MEILVSSITVSFDAVEVFEETADELSACFRDFRNVEPVVAVRSIPAWIGISDRWITCICCWRKDNDCVGSWTQWRGLRNWGRCLKHSRIPREGEDTTSILNAMFH